VHFKHVKFSGEELDRIVNEIQKVKKYPEKEKHLKQLKSKFEQDKDLDKYTSGVQTSEREFVKESTYEYKGKGIKIKYLANHYYLPVLVSETEKIDYLNHIINVDSEIRFIEELEEYLAKPDNVFTQFDWWMFSKLDQTLDEVFIPYYNPKENKIANFKPDFIFWAQKGKRYLILFVDPKGTEHADGYRKIDGYSRIFEIEEGGQKVSRVFLYNGFVINTKLLLKPRRGIAEVLDNYKRYWFDNFDDFAGRISGF